MLAGGLERGGTACVFSVKDVAQQVGQHPSHRTHNQCLRFPAHRPASTWVDYTTSCRRQSSAPEDGQKNYPEHVELI